MKITRTNPLINFKFLAVLLAAGLVLWGCDQGVPETEETSSTAATTQSVDQALKLNSTFEKLAASLALAMDDPNVRVALKNELKQRYTGAPEAIYQRIKGKDISGGPPLQQRLAQAYAQLRRQSKGKPTSAQEALRDVKKYVARIPKLHFAMPLHLDEWETQSEAPLVTYQPVDVEEQFHKSFEVKAFDSSGESHLLRVDSDHIYDTSTGKPVDRPVVVLAINERTNADGEVLPAYASGSGTGASTNAVDKPGVCDMNCDDDGSGGGGSGGGGGGTNYATDDRQYGDAEYIQKYRVIDDEEYATMEPAEIKVQINGSADPWTETSLSTAYDGQFDETDDGADFRTADRFMFYWYENTVGQFLAVHWYEQDGGSTTTFGAEKGGISFGWKYTNDNDDLGTVKVDHRDSYTRSYNTGYMEWVQRWQRP